MNNQGNYPGLQVFSQRMGTLEHFRRNWGWFLALGIVLMLLGVLAIGSMHVVTDIYVVFLGILLLIGGLLQIGYAFWNREWSGFFISLLAGVLYTVVGVMFVTNPTVSAVSLTLLLAAIYLIVGVFRIVGAAMMRFDQWGWALFSGVVNFVLGLLILLGWPETGLWVFGLFIGIDLIVYGWFWVVLSQAIRNVRIR